MSRHKLSSVAKYIFMRSAAGTPTILMHLISRLAGIFGKLHYGLATAFERVLFNVFAAPQKSGFYVCPAELRRAAFFQRIRNVLHVLFE